MNLWIAVALVGSAFLVVQTAAVVRDYRHGWLGRAELALHLLAAIMVVSIALVMLLFGTPEDPAPGFAIFFPLWIALIVAAHHRRQRRLGSRGRSRQN